MELRRNPSVKNEVRKGQQATAESENMLGLPSEQDWKLIARGSYTQTLEEREAVILEGTEVPCIYQVGAGSCLVRKNMDGEDTAVGEIKEGSMFGEISYLNPSEKNASASIIASKDDTMVNCIEKYYLEILFEYYPSMEARFYHYLAHILSTRIKQREEGQSESKQSEEVASQ
mmetsp:Transcript_20399/g.22660  ORF Transcript_20399/g.22660 Transcript_20399/m.22660 type:complete len:173 (+) Transcript_20399:589-1107(+)